MFVWLILEHCFVWHLWEWYWFSVDVLNSDESCGWWLFTLKSITYSGVNKYYILKICFSMICQRGRLLFLLDWLHFAKQQHREVFKVFKINLAYVSCIEVQKGHMLDAMSHHVGTTPRSCIICHCYCILEDLWSKIG